MIKASNPIDLSLLSWKIRNSDRKLWMNGMADRLVVQIQYSCEINTCRIYVIVIKPMHQAIDLLKACQRNTYHDKR